MAVALPDRLKIGPVVYAVMEVEHIKTYPEQRNEHGVVIENETEVLGDIQYEQAVIRIRTDQNAQMKAVHLMHEVIHGLLRHAGRLSEDGDESLVIALSYALTDLIRDNPSLIALLWDNPDLMAWYDQQSD